MWILSLLVLAVPLAGQAAEHPLIIEDGRFPSSAAQRLVPVPRGFPATRRSRPVRLAPVVARAGDIAAGDTLRLDLFEDAAYIARIDRTDTDAGGALAVRGRIDGSPTGYVIVSTAGNRSLVSVEVPEKGQSFLVQSDAATGQHYLLDLDTQAADVLADDAVLIPPAPAQQSYPVAVAAPPPGPTDPATIDTMIVYTPAARTWADTSGGGIANVISQAFQKAQLAMDNSNTQITLRLVYSGETSYTESGSANTDLNRLTNASDTYMDSVHTLRTQYGADLVCLFEQISDTGGIGWLLSSVNGSPSYAFCLCRVQQVAWTYTYAHESGHNMGCGHAKGQSTQPGPGLFSYSAGWNWTGTNGSKYCSLMSYGEGGYTAVAHYSNPSINYQGVATGHAADGDNARTLRETKHAVAGYKPTVSANNPPATPTPVSPANGTLNQGLTPTLRASAFSDPNAGNTHANSQWQVDNDSAFAGPDWDSGQAYAATVQANVPAGRLAVATRYYWRVRYKDNQGTWSNWSSPAWSFATAVPGDLSGDGCVDVVDLLTFAEAWGTQTGDPKFDPASDFNSDGWVDIVDLMTLANSWQTCI